MLVVITCPSYLFLFSPHFHPRVVMALPDVIFLRQIQHVLAPVSHLTHFMGGLPLHDVLVPQLMMMNHGNLVTT